MTSRGSLIDRARAIQRNVAYPIYWAGTSISGLSLTDVVEGDAGTTLVYGTCEAKGDSGCSPPLSIQTTSICRRNALILDVRPESRFSTRGATVRSYNGDLQLATNVANVSIFAHDPDVARRAVRTLRLLNTGRQQRLAAPRYPTYYVAHLRRLSRVYARTDSLHATAQRLHQSVAATRFQLGLARELGPSRLRRFPGRSPSLEAIKRQMASRTMATTSCTTVRVP